jgi:hypothetical protein
MDEKVKNPVLPNEVFSMEKAIRLLIFDLRFLRRLRRCF